MPRFSCSRSCVFYTMPTLAILVACFLWGASFLLAKIALAELSAMHVVLYRFLLAAATLIPLLMGQRRPRVERADWGLILLAGALTVPGLYLLQFAGLARTTGSVGALILGLLPPMLAVAAFLFNGERLTLLQWLAVLVSALGIGIIAGVPQPGSEPLGMVLVALSLVLATASVLAMQRLIARYGALTATALTLCVGTLILVPWVLLVDGLPPLSLSWQAWSAIAGLGLGCTTVAYVLWNWGLKRVTTSQAGVYANVEPVAGVALSAVLLNEHLGWAALFGGALIIGASVVVSLPAPPTAAPHDVA